MSKRKIVFNSIDEIKHMGEYWKKNLNGDFEESRLPGDFIPEKDKNIRSCSLKISDFAGEFLLKAVKNNNMGLFIFLTAVLKIQLSLYNRGRDGILGIPLFQEKDTGLNTNYVLPLLTDINEDESFKTLLQKVKKGIQEGYKNQLYPLDKIMGWKEKKKAFKINCAGREVHKDYQLENIINSPESDFTLVFHREEEGITLHGYWNANIFREDTVESFLMRFNYLLEQIGKDVNGKIRELDLITERERNLILEEFAGVETPYPKEKTVDEQFEEMAAQYPEKIIVKTEMDSISFKGLNERANQIGRYLKENGMKLGEIVPILFDKNIEMMASILGIIKAGGAYLPISPTAPKERIKYMIEDSGGGIVLTEKKHLSKIHSSRRILGVDEGAIEKFSTENMKREHTWENLAYVIYTSGSTGNPKGTPICHYNVNRALKNTNYVDISPKETMLLLGNYTFDASIMDIFGVFTGGARLILPSKETVLDMKKLGNLIKKEKVTQMIMSTALLNAVIDFNPYALKNLKKVYFGGEKASIRHIKKALEIIGEGRLVNLYGPTESTLCATFFQINSLEDCRGDISIGKPISNTKVYVIDQWNKLLPPGVPGEIALGGEGLSKGYLNREELSREKFISNPFSEGEKLYKTGDIGKWREDGNLDFINRKDNQIKLRGFRIELDEIKNAFLRIENVLYCEVLLMEMKNKEREICAYYTSTLPIKKEDIVKTLGENLLEHMIPTRLIRIEEFPLNVNGKVNKRALPHPEEVENLAEFKEPRNPLDKKILKMWKEIFSREDIGINDNFFKLGGHSLKATVFVSKLSKDTNKDISLESIFKHPTVMELSDYVAGLEESEIFQIRKSKKEKSYLASSAQKRMYLLQQFEPEGVQYNMPLIFNIKGKFHVDRLSQAFITLVNRHEIFRTYFTKNGDEVLQNINRDVEFQVARRHVKKEEVQEAIRDFVKPFHLEKAPLLRVEVMSLGDDEYVLLLDMHHIISDGESVKLMLGEISALYKGETLGDEGLQYRDFSKWQRGFLESGGIESQRDYWMEKLKGELPVLKITTDYQRPPVQSFKGEELRVSLGEELTEKIREFAVDQNSTVYTILLGAVNVLLSRYSSSEDIIVGSPVAGRNQQNTENIMGLFVNTIAMRNFPYNDIPFKEFLSRVRENFLGGIKNSDYQFEELIEDLDIRRDPSRNPIFDVMFTMNNIWDGNFNFEGVEASLLRRKSGISKFDLTFAGGESEKEIFMDIEYCSDLFSEDTVERMGGHLKNILKSICENPLQEIGEISMISPEEEGVILERFNDTGVDYRKDRVIQEIFNEASSKYRDDIAVKMGKEELSYRELNKRSNILALELEKQGVGREKIVGVMFKDTMKAVVSIMAVLKAGGAYLPIDWNNPKERIKYIMEDSSALMLLSEESLLRESHYKEEWGWFDFDSVDYSLDGIENRPPTNSPEDLCYVIYTSGSTGKPKGVMVEHRNVVNLSNWFNRKYKIRENRNVLNMTNITFDVSVEEIIVTLLNGGTVHIPHKEKIMNPEEFHKFVLENNINIAQFVPATLKELLIDSDYIEGLNVVICGGEKLSPSLKEAVIKKGYNLFNHYGPTEITVDAIYTRCDQKNVIGKPVDNCGVFILDEREKLQGIGVPGEIVVFGEGVTRGYLNRESLTEERFIDNPYKSKEKMYKTGDLGRWLPDGNIEFFHRKDNQIKMRGYRIELGEIENILQAHPKIQSAAVDIKEKGEMVLCAYIVTSENLENLNLREYLKGRVPEYMIPTYFTLLDEIPLNSNGKVSRKSLPIPHGEYGESNYTKPRNKIEEELCTIWAKNLNLLEVGIDQDFFRLGGHSLKGLGIVNEVNSKLQGDITLKDIFENSTVREMAKLLENGEHKDRSDIKKAVEKELYRTSSAQKRMYFMNSMNTQSTAYNMPMFLKIKGKMECGKIEEALKELVSRHEALRTSFVNKNGEIYQKIHKDIEGYFHIYPSHMDVERMVGEFLQPFDLEVPPLIKVGVSQREEGEIIFMMDMHHIISDGESMKIIIEDFLNLYCGKGVESHELQYKDYAESQVSSINEEYMKNQQEYWGNVFEDGGPEIELPYDFKVANEDYQGDVIKGNIDKELTDKIKEFAKREKLTVQMILLGALDILLSKYSMEEDIVVGIPTSGRFNSDTEKIVGLFVNTLPLRTFVDGEKRVGEFLTSVKEKISLAYENGEYQLEQLIEKLNIKRKEGHNPLFDVVLNVHNEEEKEEVFHMDMIIEPILLEKMPAKFHLSINGVVKKETIEISGEYRKSLFRRKTVDGIMKHYINILGEIVRDKNKVIKDIEYVTGEEQKSILGKEKSMKGSCSFVPIIDTFEKISRENSGKIAVSLGENEITYDQLYSSAGAIGKMLRSKGVNRGDIVALMVPRSVDMIVGIMGILLAGGAYLPIDPELPLKRRDYILRDSGVEFLLLSDETCEKLEYRGEKINIASYPKNQIHSFERKIEERAEDPAYVIYTSGTTGNPKGVKVTRGNLHNFIEGFTGSFRNGISEEDKVLSLTNYSFDVSVCEIFSALLKGATLVLNNKHKTFDPGEIGKLIVDNEITFTYIPPSILAHTHKVLEPHKEKLKLNKLLVGVQGIKGKTLKSYKELKGDMEIINGYGPTETTICASLYSVDGSERENENVPIGKPMDNTQIYILNKHGNLQPRGIKGEICIGGKGVADGYLNNTALSGEKFIESRHGVGKIYRTGDLGLWNSDGNLVFKGRKDHQVKIRGYRVELQEIKKRIRDYPGVYDAEVLLKEDQFICAYVHSSEKVSDQKLRGYLNEYLPDYMIPGVFVQIEEIPLTANGKVDSKKLLQIEVELSSQEHVPPSTDTEKQVAAIWEEALNIKGIGIKDKFFHVGGNSLTGIKILYEIKEKFKIDMELKEFFRMDNIEELSRFINEIEKDEGAENTIPRLDEKEYYDLSYGQKRLWIINELHNGSTAYNISGSLTLQEKLESELVRETLDILLQRHEGLRTSFVKKYGAPYQKINKDVHVGLQEYDISGLPQEERWEKATEIAQKTGSTEFELSKAPLIKVVMVKLGEEEYNLIFSMHHIISDGWSISLLQREFKEIYDGLKKGITPQLKELRVQYKDFAHWQNSMINNDGKWDRAKEYWMEELKRNVRPLDLSGLYGKNERGELFKTSGYTFFLQEGERNRLREISKEMGTSLYTIVLGMFNLVLWNLTKEEEFLIGTATFGRNNPDLENIIGYFINTTIIRNHLKKDYTFPEYIRELNERVVDSLEYQSYPIEALLTQLNMKYPKITVFFNMLNILESQDGKVEDFTSKHKEEMQESKFPISCYCRELGNGMQFDIAYYREYFQKDTVEYLESQFRKLLQGLMESSEENLVQYFKRKKRVKGARANVSK